MKYYLLKSDPDTYSLEDLEKDKETLWDGIHNFQAINFIKKMEIGDKAYIYHSQTDKAIVGLAEIISEPEENLKDPRKSWAVEIKFLKKYSKTVSLQELKNHGGFNDFLLIRNGRLSVMEVPKNVQEYLEKKLS